MKSTTTLHLAKQNFKFSSGHFLIFDHQLAEKLHGHNYSVKFEIETSDAAEFKAQGYWIDFNVLKKMIKAQLDLWDEHVLLPKLHPDMKITSENKNYQIHFRDRFYSLPQNEVVLLPVRNTSVEELSRLLAEELLTQMKPLGVKTLQVLVEETAGQGASTKVGL
jgi:6-pyruvoyltetrahydropterin/6-carboxytetrahydropterin synthase